MVVEILISLPDAIPTGIKIYLMNLSNLVPAKAGIVLLIEY